MYLKHLNFYEENFVKELYFFIVGTADGIATCHGLGEVKKE